MYVGEIVSFLFIAHGPNSLFHARLSPRNCCIFQNKHLKVKNFASSKFFGHMEQCNVIPIGAQNQNFANDPEVLGNLNYFSPEFIEFGQESPAMDFWALGCILYFMLTGKEPFEGRSPQDVIHNIINNELEELDDDLNISEEAKDVLDKLLQLNPVLRLGAGQPE